MAAGLPALANMLGDEGFSVEIVHLGIESEVQQGFSLRRYLVTHRPRLVLFSLHWNQQTRPVLDVAEKVRRWLPETRIILGGLTASVFALDVVSTLGWVDGVIRGLPSRYLSERREGLSSQVSLLRRSRFEPSDHIRERGRCPIPSRSSSAMGAMLLPKERGPSGPLSTP